MTVNIVALPTHSGHFLTAIWTKNLDVFGRYQSFPQPRILTTVALSSRLQTTLSNSSSRTLIRHIDEADSPQKLVSDDYMMLTGQVAVGEMLAEISSGVIQLFVVKPWHEEHLREVLERAGATLDLRRQRGKS